MSLTADASHARGLWEEEGKSIQTGSEGEDETCALNIDATKKTKHTVDHLTHRGRKNPKFVFFFCKFQSVSLNEVPSVQI